MNRKQTEAEQKEDALQPTQGERLLAHGKWQWGEQPPAQGWTRGDAPASLGSGARSPLWLWHSRGKLRMP